MHCFLTRFFFSPFFLFLYLRRPLNMFIKSVLLAAVIASASSGYVDAKAEPTPPAHTSKLVVRSFFDVERGEAKGMRKRPHRARAGSLSPQNRALQPSARPKPELSCRIP